MKSLKVIYSALFITVSILLTSCGSEPEVPKYERFSFELVPIKSGDKWGYINTKGDLTVNPQFKAARPFADGRAAVCSQDDQWGYIDTSGNYVINPNYKFVSDFSEGLAVVVRPNGHPELIDTAGNVKGSFNNATFLSVPSDGLLRFESQENSEEEIGYMSKDGKVSISPQFYEAYMFTEGLAAFAQKNDNDTLWGYIDLKGKTVVNPQFDWAGQFSDSLALIRVDDKYGYINKKGKIVINPQFESADAFKQGFAAIKMGDQWGYIDKKGKIVINPQFEKAMPFYNSLAAVRMSENKWGYIDTTGKYKVNPQFKAAGSFHHANFAAVKIGDKIGFIDSLGKYVVNPQYDDTYMYHYDDFMGDYNAYNGVMTNYLDMDKIMSNLFTSDYKNLKGYDKKLTLREVRKKYKESEMTDKYDQVDVDFDNFVDIYGGISLTGIQYNFNSPLQQLERRYWGPYSYQYELEWVDNNSTTTNRILALVSLGYGVGYDRAKDIAEKMSEKISKKHNIDFEIDKKDNDVILHTFNFEDDHQIIILYKEDENSFAIGVAY